MIIILDHSVQTLNDLSRTLFLVWREYDLVEREQTSTMGRPGLKPDSVPMQYCNLR